MPAPLLHLGLLVRDQPRSMHFYATYFGFDAAGARRYSDGTVIVRNARVSTWPCTQALPHSASRPLCISGSSFPTPTP